MTREPCVCSGAAWSSLMLMAPNVDAPMPVNDCDCDRQSSRSSADDGSRRPRVGRHEIACSSSARSKLKPRMNAALMMVKPRVLAPMPSAIAAIAAAENQRSLTHQADREAQVLPEILEGAESAHVAMLRLQRGRRRRADGRAAARLVGRHAVADVALRSPSRDAPPFPPRNRDRDRRREDSARSRGR